MTDNKRDGEVYGLMLCFLCNLKNKILKSNGVDIKIDTGFLAAAGYIDRTINTLMSQQTTIAALQSELRIEKKYASAWGDFFGYTPQELQKEEQEEIREHMKILEEKWKKRQDEEIKTEVLLERERK